MILTDCGVEFNEKEHSYLLNGNELSGITGIISTRLFPQKYINVPESTLQKAAERGNNIHYQCALSDDLPIESEYEEVINYKALIDKNELNVECSEYLVTDYKRIASAIDKVFRVSEDEFILGDIKTTYRLDKKFLMWQLSIYAWLFELVNSGAKVKQLLGIWLKNEKARLVEIERLPTEKVKALIDFHFDNFENEDLFLTDI